VYNSSIGEHRCEPMESDQRVGKKNGIIYLLNLRKRDPH
jgi:hypothetical protein